MTNVLVCSECGDRVADGMGQSVGAPCLWANCRGLYRDPVQGVPQSVINAAVVAAMREHTHNPYYARQMDHYQWHDMTPVVHRAESLGGVNEWGDSWVVEVQYSSKGGRAVYGVNRDNVPQCYAD